MHAIESRCRSGVPTLYYDELSPQSRSCCMLIKVLDIEVEYQQIDLINDEHSNDSFGKFNPSDTIPTLIDDQYIFRDGHTIMMYLCDKYAGVYLPHLCPRDYLPRLNVLNMLFYEGCVLYRRYSHLLTEILLKKYPNVELSYHQAKIRDCYNTLDTNLKGQSCMTGNCLTIADLSVVTTLSGLDLMFPISQQQWPNLHRWFGNLKTMDCYESNDEGLRKLSHFLETEGQFPLPSPLTLEATLDMRSSLQTSADVDKENMKTTELEETTELPINKRSSLRETEVSKEDEENSQSSSKEDITSAPTKDESEIKLPTFLPKIRTSKIITRPSHSDHEAESSPEVYEKPVDKKLRDSEVESVVEDSQTEEKGHNKASDCLCCCRSFILKRGNMDWICSDCIQKNQGGPSSENNGMINIRMTGSNLSQVEDTIVMTCSAKSTESPQTTNKVKCVEFECQFKNEEETQYYPDHHRQCTFDEGDLREFKSCLRIENCNNCDLLCPCALRMAEIQSEATEMEDPCSDEFEFSDNEANTIDNQECDIDGESHEDISDEDCESYEEYDGEKDKDDNSVCFNDIEDREYNFVCSCVDEDDNDNRFQEEFCSCVENKEDKDFCCCKQNPLEVEKVSDDLVCCCDYDQPNCNDTTNDLEYCCEGDISNSTNSDNTSHITICLCDGSPAKPLAICYNDNRQTIENCSKGTLSCYCQNIDTSNDDNYCCENDCQDSEYYDVSETTTDDGHIVDSTVSHREGNELANSNTSNATLISFNDGDCQEGHKFENVLNCSCVIRGTSRLVCSCFAHEHRKGHSEDQPSCSKPKPTGDGFRHDAKQNRVGKCCCRPDINCHKRMETINEIRSHQNCPGDKETELHPALRDKRSNKVAAKYCTSSKSVMPTYSPRYICTCDAFDPLPNRESVMQRLHTQCIDCQGGTPKKCCCSAKIVDMKNWNISQARNEESDVLYKHETLLQQRRTFGSYKAATQQNTPIKNVHKSDDDKVNGNAKTITDTSKGRSSAEKSFEKPQSRGHEGSERKSELRSKANTTPVSGTRKEPLEEVQNNDKIVTTHPGKPKTSANKVPLSAKKSPTQPESSAGLEKKAISKDIKTDMQIKTSQDLSKISDDVEDSKSYGLKTKKEKTDKTGKGNTEMLEEAKIKENGKGYQTLSKSYDNKTSKVEDKSKDVDRNASKEEKARALASEPANTDPHAGGKGSRSVHKPKENVTGSAENDIAASKIDDQQKVGPVETASDIAPDSAGANDHGRANKESKSETEGDVETSPVDKLTIKQAHIKTVVQKVRGQAPISLRTGTENKAPESEDKEPEQENNTKENEEAGNAYKQGVKQAASKSGNEQRVSQAPEKEDKEQGHGNNTEKIEKTRSTNKQQVKQTASTTGNEQRPSQAYRAITAETSKRLPDRATKKRVKQPFAKSTNGRRVSQAFTDKRGSKANTDKVKVSNHDNQHKTNGITEMHPALWGPLNSVRIKCAKCPSSSAVVCVTVPNSQEQEAKCWKCQTHCTCILAEESAPLISCPAMESKMEQCCESCPHQSRHSHCEEQRPYARLATEEKRPCGRSGKLEWQSTNCESFSICDHNSEQREKFNCKEQHPCEIFRVEQSNYPTQPASCSKVRSASSTSFQVRNWASDPPCVALPSIQPDRAISCEKSVARPRTCCPSGNKDYKNRTLNCKKIVCTPKRAARKTKRLSAGSSQSKTQSLKYCSCVKQSNRVLKQNVPSLREKNELQCQKQLVSAHEIHDSSSNISQGEITSIKHFYNWDDLKGKLPEASVSKRPDIKNSKIPRLILPKVYLVYRESHDMKPSQIYQRFSKFPKQNLYGGQDNVNGNQAKPLRYTYQEPKCSEEVIKKCCGTNPSRIPQLYRNSLSPRSRSGTTGNATTASGSLDCAICEKYLQAKSASNERGEDGQSGKSLGDVNLETSQTKSSRFGSNNRETICITKVECCNSNGCLIKEVSRVTTTSVRRESPSYAQNLESFPGSLTSTLEAVNVSRKEENKPISMERENEKLNGSIRLCKCCHCREEKTANLREGDNQRYEREAIIHEKPERTGNIFVFQNNPVSQDRQSLRASAMKNSDKLNYKTYSHSATQDLPVRKEQRQYPKKSHQINYKQSGTASALEQSKHYSKFQNNDNAPQDDRASKPKEFSSYPSSHRDGSKNMPKPAFTVEQNKSSPNRIRGGVTNQLGNEIKSDTFVRTYECLCKKLEGNKKCTGKKINRDLPNDSEYCTCDSTAAINNNSAHREPRASAYSESRLSKLINSPRRTIKNSETSEVSQLQKSAIPKKLESNPHKRDTASRIYGCSCKRMGETKVTDKCIRKRRILAPNEYHHIENDYCRCDSNVDRYNGDQSFLSKNHNPNPVILKVSINSCSERNNKLECKCCKEKKEREENDDMAELSCICSCVETERQSINENYAIEVNDEQIVAAEVKEGPTSEDEDSTESNENNSSHSGQSPNEDSRNMTQSLMESKFMTTTQIVPATETSKSNKEMPKTAKERKSLLPKGYTSQKEDLIESNKDITIRHNQSSEEDSGNMKLSHIESKSVKTNQDEPAVDTSESNKESTAVTKERKLIDQTGEASQEENSSPSHKDNTTRNNQSPKEDSRNMKLSQKDNNTLPGKQEVPATDIRKTKKKKPKTMKERKSMVHKGGVSHEEELAESSKNNTFRHSQSPKDDTRNIDLSQNVSKSMPSQQDVSARDTSNLNMETPKTTKERKSTVQKSDASQEEDSPESNRNKTIRHSKSQKEYSRNFKLSPKENKPMLPNQDVSAAETPKSNREIPKTTKEEKSTIQRGNALGRKGTEKEIKTNSVSENLPNDSEYELTKDSPNVNGFRETGQDVSPMEEQDQSENRENITSSKEITLQVYRCMCGRIIPCPYRQNMRKLECLEKAVEKCCRSQTSEEEDDQSNEKEILKPQHNYTDESSITTLESKNDAIQEKHVVHTDSKENEATTSSFAKKDNSKDIDKRMKTTAKSDGKEIKKDVTAVGRKSKESTETNGKGNKEILPAGNTFKTPMKMNGKLNTPRNSNDTKAKEKTDVASKNNRTTIGRISRDETVKYKSNLAGAQTQSQESSETSKQSASIESTPINLNTIPENCFQDPMKQDEQKTLHSKAEEESNANKQDFPETMCDMSDEAFMKDFDPDDANISGSCDVMVVTKRTRFLKRNGEEKIEEKRLVITKPSATDMGNCSHVGIPEPESEVIKKCKRIGDKVCTVTITKGNKVKKRSAKCCSDKG